MTEESCDAQLWINMNYEKVTDILKWQAKLTKQSELQAKKRAANEAAYAALVSKRMRS
jgi:hypothetical protein